MAPAASSASCIQESALVPAAFHEHVTSSCVIPLGSRRYLAARANSYNQITNFPRASWHSGMSFPVLRHQPSGSGALRFGSACGRSQAARRNAWTACPRPSLAGDESLLALAGVSAPILHRIRHLAIRWGVPLREAALSTGAVSPQSYQRAVALACGLEPRQAREDILLRQLPAVPEPYRLLASRQPVPLEVPRRAVAINAESVSPEDIAEIAGALGPARDRLVLIGRRALTGAITESLRTAARNKSLGWLASAKSPLQRRNRPRRLAGRLPDDHGGPLPWRRDFRAARGTCASTAPCCH